MTRSQFLDFDFLVQRAAQGYRAHVVTSPAGQASVEFKPPFSASELAALLERISRALSMPDQWTTDGLVAARTLGGKLFSAGLAGDVRVCLQTSIAEAERQGAGLRIRLRLSDVPELAALPWEYLYDPAAKRFLALSTETPLVRYLEMPERAQPLAIEPPLRILALIARPKGLGGLDAEQEWLGLREQLADLERQGRVVIKPLEHATFAALQSRLQAASFHVLHFMGHGAFDEATQEGVLIFESDAGQARSVSGQDMGILLHDVQMLRLVILTSCEGARPSRDDLFGGVAQSLVRQGIPAVIAMQTAISDGAALVFTQSFYSALADGYAVDAALAETRKAIFARIGGLEWGTPALYMRAPDGVLWDLKGVADKATGKQAAKATSWWHRLPSRVGGDVIIAEVGAGARGVAVGKGITQILYETLGEPEPDDKQAITRQFRQVTASLQRQPGQFDAATAKMAEFQLKLLHGELTKTGEGEVPSAGIITQIGDRLLQNQPALAEELTSLFAMPAVGRVVGKAGETAIAWVQDRFGGAS